MVALRSARLEALLGSDIEQVQHPQVMTLISNQVAEAFDLDFKSEMHGSSDRDKRDAATDAALANTAGGLLILTRIGTGARLSAAQLGRCLLKRGRLAHPRQSHQQHPGPSPGHFEKPIAVVPHGDR
jgi:hypothetical protein